tara:strand:- start:76 stop:543 length:468 start_codon:yes stop_codon:yes gene_type:complete
MNIAKYLQRNSNCLLHRYLSTNAAAPLERRASRMPTRSRSNKNPNPYSLKKELSMEPGHLGQGTSQSSIVNRESKEGVTEYFNNKTFSMYRRESNQSLVRPTGGVGFVDPNDEVDSLLASYKNYVPALNQVGKEKRRHIIHNFMQCQNNESKVVK